MTIHTPTIDVSQDQPQLPNQHFSPWLRGQTTPHKPDLRDLRFCLIPGIVGLLHFAFRRAKQILKTRNCLRSRTSLFR